MSELKLNFILSLSYVISLVIVMAYNSSSFIKPSYALFQ